MPLGGSAACKSAAMDMHFYNQIKNQAAEEYHAAYGNSCPFRNVTKQLCVVPQRMETSVEWPTSGGKMQVMSSLARPRLTCRYEPMRFEPPKWPFYLRIKYGLYQTNLDMVYYNTAVDSGGYSRVRDQNLGCEGNKTSCKRSSLLRCVLPPQTGPNSMI